MGRKKKRSGLKLIDSIDKYGRHDWTRTSDLFRVKAAMITVSTTYKWVRELPSTPKHLQALRCQAILGLGVGLRCTVGNTRWTSECGVWGESVQGNRPTVQVLRSYFSLC